MSGIVYILFSGAPWHLLPKDYPPYQTCHRYFQQWTQAGILEVPAKCESVLCADTVGENRS